MSSRIEAAGGVLWRPDGRGLQVAVVHRPAYDDWSLPKGKLAPGEPALLGALREVREETGWECVPGRALGEVHYEKSGRPKRVRYWSLRADRGQFQPSEEVDRLEWLTPNGARSLLDEDRDLDVLDRFLAGSRWTWPLVLVRHASAGERGTSAGPDSARPLDATGRGQAGLLASVLSAHRPTALHAAAVTRCTSTLEPLASRVGVPVLATDLLAEDGDASAALDLLLSLVSTRAPTVVCSQRGPLPDLVVELCARLGQPRPDLAPPAKADGWVLHVTADPDPRLVQVDALAAAL